MSDTTAGSPNDHHPLSELSLLVLLSLGNGPAHGYAIGKEVQERSSGRLNPTTGALYQALKRLRDEGLLAPALEQNRDAEDGRRRYFRLTERGREVAALEVGRLEELVGMARDNNLYPTSS